MTKETKRRKARNWLAIHAFRRKAGPHSKRKYVRRVKHKNKGDE